MKYSSNLIDSSKVASKEVNISDSGTYNYTQYPTGIDDSYTVDNNTDISTQRLFIPLVKLELNNDLFNTIVNTEFEQFTEDVLQTDDLTIEELQVLLEEERLKNTLNVSRIGELENRILTLTNTILTPDQGDITLVSDE